MYQKLGVQQHGTELLQKLQNEIFLCGGMKSVMEDDV